MFNVYLKINLIPINIKKAKHTATTIITAEPARCCMYINISFSVVRFTH